MKKMRIINPDNYVSDRERSERISLFFPSPKPRLKRLDQKSIYALVLKIRPILILTAFRDINLKVALFGACTFLLSPDSVLGANQ